MWEFSFDRGLVLELQSSILIHGFFSSNFNTLAQFVVRNQTDAFYIHSAAWDTLELQGFTSSRYHLFVSIRYHKKNGKAIWKII